MLREELRTKGARPRTYREYNRNKRNITEVKRTTKRQQKQAECGGNSRKPIEPCITNPVKKLKQVDTGIRNRQGTSVRPQRSWPNAEVVADDNRTADMVHNNG